MTDAIEHKMQLLYEQLTGLRQEPMKSVIDERTQDALELVYEILGMLRRKS